MKELHTFGWYAARIKPHLPKEAFKPVPARLWGGLAYLLVTIAGFLVIGLLDLHVMIYGAIAVILGACFAAMGFLGHEILHGTVVRKGWLRDLLGAIAFFPLSTGPSLWRKWHNLTHHVHTQDDEHDPDSWPTLERMLKKPIFRWVYRLPLSVRAVFSFCSLAIQFSAHSAKMFTVYIKEFNVKKRPKVWLELILPWATWISLLFIYGPIKWLFAFLIPLLIANFIVMSYISTNHRLNPLVPVNDPLANSLTVTVPKWVDVLHFNFSYHTEHHLFPGMSSKYYPLVKEQIKKRWPDRYHEMPMIKALIALWKTPRLYFQGNELVDPRKGALYGSLGNGLDPSQIQARSTMIKEELETKAKFVTNETNDKTI
ncbi:fatty acid desaturase family protein [Bacillus sp. PS06]|uniref:fatty acid desaturase family protein n=1 Tax=Bacillus sp. PS06 TaxID=2764176 RepID=UPI00177B7793|nr:acyl-CoA desaturase [Bacillus sp. PS06]MBD8070860.1 acyl-CoA desaturase [Bacillus sp. PS06]